jgi:tRNA dimethylallyltransferase
MGLTASGKSDLAIALARKEGGEIISADSRQVYRGLDLGSGKVTRAEQALVPHHLLDVADPQTDDYNVTRFVREAKRAIEDIERRGKRPIIAGGTGFFIQALLEQHSFPAVKPDAEFRKSLAGVPTAELYARVREKDPVRAETIDRKNPVRLIRALEIIETFGFVPEREKVRIKNEDYRIIALAPPREELARRIRDRLQVRFRAGMLQEVERLHEAGLSWKRLEGFGLEYKYLALFLQKKMTRKEMEATLAREILRYAKRQLTWLRRMEAQGWRIEWFSSKEEALRALA